MWVFSYGSQMCGRLDEVRGCSDRQVAKLAGYELAGEIRS